MKKIKYEALTFQNFQMLLRTFQKNEGVEDEMLYGLYHDCISVLEFHHETYENLPYVALDHKRLILHLIFDYEYRLKPYNLDQRKTLLNDDSFRGRLINTVIDKYGSISYFKYEEGRLITPYSMEISTLNVYINFILLKLTQLQVREKIKLFYLELLRSAFSLCRAINELLVDGFEKQALSVWRSLHELEATLVLVYDTNLLMRYERHVLYNAAFNSLLPKEETDTIFLEIKANMKELDLKSKDMRRYIEYGWIKYHPNFDPSVHKFNFRDGVESLAHLEKARDTYQMASEIAHSSPLLLFSNRTYFLRITLQVLYDSFLVIEDLFARIYEENADKMEHELYTLIRSIYLDDIKMVIERIK